MVKANECFDRVTSHKLTRKRTSIFLGKKKIIQCETVFIFISFKSPDDIIKKKAINTVAMTMVRFFLNTPVTFDVSVSLTLEIVVTSDVAMSVKKLVYRLM